MRSSAALSITVVLAMTGAPATAQSPGDPPTPGVDRYVATTGSDANDGSHDRPWGTLGHAAEHVNAGDTVHVAPGSYGGPLTIARGGSAESPVRFVSDQRWKASVSAESAEYVTAVEITADHVSFEGFDVGASGGDGSAAIDLEGNNDAAVGNRVRVDAPCLPSGNGAAGIVVGGGVRVYRNTGGLVDGNFVERVGSGPRDGSCRLANGIYAAVPGVTIVNNIVTRATGDGITSWHAARGLTIANNLAASNGGVGILIGSGDTAASAGGHTNSLVTNNIVYRNALAGITESSDGAHPVGPGNRYLHNLAFDNGGDPSGIGGLFPGEVLEGNLAADPRFLLGCWPAPFRYRVRPMSPAVDAGSPGAPNHDFDGVPRPLGRAVDIGPFELSPDPVSRSWVRAPGMLPPAARAG
jgi:hypothetical protein